jgi:hypothetical protein
MRSAFTCYIIAIYAICGDGFSFLKSKVPMRRFSLLMTSLNGAAHNYEDIDAKTRNKREYIDRLLELIGKDVLDSITNSQAFTNDDKDSFYDEDDIDTPFEERQKKQALLLNGVVRISCTHSEPNFLLPWQRKKQEFSSSSGFIIDNERILTNAHSVEYGSLIQVKKRQSEKKYLASVVAGNYHIFFYFFSTYFLYIFFPSILIFIFYLFFFLLFLLSVGHECDLAILKIEEEEFWENCHPLKFGTLPDLMEDVQVIGYPVGGDRSVLLATNYIWYIF